MRFSVSVV